MFYFDSQHTQPSHANYKLRSIHRLYRSPSPVLSQRNFGELCVVVSSWHKFGKLPRVNHDWIRDRASGEVYPSRQRRCLPSLFRVVSVHATRVSWDMSLSIQSRRAIVACCGTRTN
jgi:hypothetical protein